MGSLLKCKSNKQDTNMSLKLFLLVAVITAAATHATNPRFVETGALPGRVGADSAQCTGSLTAATYQVGNSWCCWLLSVLEAARHQNLLGGMCTNMVASVPAYAAKTIPKWQEAAQFLMKEEHGCLDSTAGAAKGFQLKVNGAGISCDPRTMVPK